MATLAGQGDQVGGTVISDGGAEKPQRFLDGALAPQQGGLVTDQRRGIGRYAGIPVPRQFDLSVARPALQAKEVLIPGNVFQVLRVDGGSIPDDARISVGDSDYFPLVEGWIMEVDTPFRGYSLYWPTAAVGVTIWIVTVLSNRPDTL